ncbi:hypothetical protein [Paenibacillus chungangensis]|uniref:Uncharacterized protein n=1 Tax=Paenibacillus chungangensis TaxID=696535 RepID=A0ABW3HK62_9BACL
MKRTIKVSASIMIASSVAISTVNVPLALADQAKPATTQAQTNKMTAFKGADFKTFKLSSNSYIKIKDIYFQYSSSQKRVFYTLTVHNGDNTSINFMDYWVELYSGSGAKYPVKQLSGENKSTIVSAKTSRDFVFYSDINSSLSYSDLLFKVVKWDFSLPNYTRVIGQSKVTKYANAVPQNAYYVDTRDNHKIKTFLNSGSKFTMGDYNQIQIAFQMENQGMYEYVLPEYQFYLRTSKGLVVKLAAEKLGEPNLAAGEKAAYSLRTSLKKSIDLTNSQILVSTIESESKVEMPIGIYNIRWGQQSDFVVDEKAAAKLTVNSIPVEASIVNIYNYQNGSQNEIILTTSWLNKGQEAVELPGYKYELMTADGTRYPISAGDTESASQLVPGVEQELSLQAAIPDKVKEGLTLLVKQPKSETNSYEYVLAAFKLSKLEEMEGVTKKSYKSDKGLYEVDIEKVERLPWGNQDILNIHVDVENIGKEYQAIPQLNAILRLNGLLINKENVQLIELNSEGIIGPQNSARYVITTKVPYTYQLSEVSVNLSDQVNDNSKQTIGLFKFDEVNELEEVGPLDKYKIDSMGRRASVDFMNYFLFEGKDNDMLYAEFNYTNEETRYSTLPALKAYFKSGDGQFIDAELANVKTRIKPDGSGIISVMAPVPKTFVDEGDTQLLIGEAVQDGKYSTAEGTPDSFISVKAFNLPKIDNPVQDVLHDLKLEPYEFTLHKLNTMLIDVSNVKLQFNYTLFQSGAYDVNEQEKKLYFEVTNGSHSYGTSVTIEPESGEGLEVGRDKELIVPIQGTQLANMMYGGYSVSIYEEIDGYKRLLGTKRYGQFQISNN